MVLFVRTLTVTGNLDPLGAELLLATCKSKKRNVMEDEEPFVKDMPAGPLDRVFCERYARFYEGKGFQAIARRIRDLAAPEQIALPLVEKKQSPGRRAERKK
jgi:hypothetical protein